MSPGNTKNSVKILHVNKKLCGLGTWWQKKIVNFVVDTGQAMLLNTGTVPIAINENKDQRSQNP